MRTRFIFMFLAVVLVCGCGVSGGGGDAGTTSTGDGGTAGSGATGTGDSGATGTGDSGATGTGGSGTTGTGGSGTTGTGDVTKPTIIATSPCDCGEHIPTDATVSVIFSEAVNPSTVSSGSIRIRHNFSNISGTYSFSPSGAAATFRPSRSLTPFTTYTAEVTTDVTDMAGNALELNKKLSFYTTGSTATSRFSDVQQIFNNNCTTCHQKGGQSEFLPLTNDVAYEKLINRRSTYTANGILVRNGNYLDSILYQRISGSILPSMPLDQPFLNSTSQNVIKTWIFEGALNN